MGLWKKRDVFHCLVNFANFSPFKMRRRISIRGRVHPSVRPLVRPLVRLSVRLSRVIFRRVLDVSCAVYPALFISLPARFNENVKNLARLKMSKRHIGLWLVYEYVTNSHDESVLHVINGES